MKMTQRERDTYLVKRKNPQETLADVARRTGTPYGTLYRRVVMQGMSLEDAMQRRPMTPHEVGKHAGVIGAQARWGKS